MIPNYGLQEVQVIRLHLFLFNIMECPVNCALIVIRDQVRYVGYTLSSYLWQYQDSKEIFPEMFPDTGFIPSVMESAKTLIVLVMVATSPLFAI